MRVFLTGGTGYIGGVLQKKLLGRGIEVVSLARPVRRGALVSGGGLEWLFGELNDHALVADAARRTDATIHVAARHDATMERLDAAAIKSIADGLRGSGKPFITTSATPVYGDTGPTPRDESEPVAHPFPMRLFRLDHDRFVAGLSSENVRGIVIRPPFVYGRAAGFLVTLIRQAVEDRIARIIGDGTNQWSTVNVDDLADLYILALLNGDAHGVYNAGSRDLASMGDIARAIAQAFGPDIAIGTWSEAEAVARLGPLMPIMALEQRVASERAYRELGWRPGKGTLLNDLREGSYRQNPLIAYSH